MANLYDRRPIMPGDGAWLIDSTGKIVGFEISQAKQQRHWLPGLGDDSGTAVSLGAVTATSVAGGTMTGSTLDLSSRLTQAGGLATEYILAKSAVAVSCGADVTEDTLATITVPANAMGPNGVLRIRLDLAVTNSANNKTIRARWSGGSGTDILSSVITTVNAARYDSTIANVNSTGSQRYSTVITTSAAAITANGPTSVDTTAQQTLVITGQKANSGETLTLNSYVVGLIYGA